MHFLNKRREYTLRNNVDILGNIYITYQQQT